MFDKDKWIPAVIILVFLFGVVGILWGDQIGWSQILDRIPGPVVLIGGLLLLIGLPFLLMRSMGGGMGRGAWPGGGMGRMGRGMGPGGWPGGGMGGMGRGSLGGGLTRNMWLIILGIVGLVLAFMYFTPLHR